MLERPTGMTRRSLITLFAVAGVLRLALVFLAPTTLSGDELEYDALARGLLENGTYSKQPGFSPLLYSAQTGSPTAFRPPGWPFLLACIYRAFGPAPDVARIVLAIWGGIGCCWLAVLAGHVFRSSAVGLGAGLVWAMWPASLFYPDTRSSALGTESVATPLLCAAICLLVNSARRGVWVVLATGALLGLATLMRSNLVLLVPLAALWLVAATNTPFPKRVLRAAFVVGAACAVLLPWAIRNHAKLGVLTLATQREPLFLGNNAWARGSYDAEFFNNPDSTQVRWLEQHYPRFVERTEVEKSRLYAHEALRHGIEHPLRQLWLVARKTVFFFSPVRMLGDRFSYDVAFATMLVPFGYGVLLVLREREPETWALLLPVLAAFATCVIVLFLPRYRFPAEPFMVAIACQGVRALAGRLGNSRAAMLIVATIAANGAVWALWRK